MVIAFLDGLAVAHDQGQVGSLSIVEEEEEGVRSAARGIVEEVPCTDSMPSEGRSSQLPAARRERIK